MYLIQLNLFFSSILGERPYKCSFCAKDYKVSSDLSRHEKAHQRKAEKLLLPYRCKTCDDRGYATKEELLKHDETVHEVARNHIDKTDPQYFKNLFAQQKKRAKKLMN